MGGGRGGIEERGGSIGNDPIDYRGHGRPTTPPTAPMVMMTIMGMDNVSVAMPVEGDGGRGPIGRSISSIPIEIVTVSIGQEAAAAVEVREGATYGAMVSMVSVKRTSCRRSSIRETGNCDESI